MAMDKEKKASGQDMTGMYSDDPGFQVLESLSRFNAGDNYREDTDREAKEYLMRVYETCDALQETLRKNGYQGLFMDEVDRKTLAAVAYFLYGKQEGRLWTDE